MNLLKNRKTSQPKEKKGASKKSDEQLELIATHLMNKKEQEHYEMFNSKNKKTELDPKEKLLEEEYRQAVKIAVNNFSINVTNSCNTLSGINTKLKKTEHREALKSASLTLLSSTTYIIKYMQSLSSVTGNLENTKVFENLIPFLKSSNNLLAGLELSDMDNEDYESAKYIIVSLSKNIVDEMGIGIKYSSLTDYGLSKSLMSYNTILKDQIVVVQKTLKKYEGKIKQLLKTIEEFNNDENNRMPLMGEAGSN